jgi:phosphoglycolate phosphatase
MTMSKGAPLVVFDLDGTLVDTIGDLVATLNVVLANEGIPPVSLEDARPMVAAGARALITRGLAAGGKAVTAERMHELFRAFLAHYEAHIAVHSRLFPGALQALDRCAAAGFRLAVLTNKFEATSVKLLTALGVSSRFAAICGQDTFAVCKPDPAALLQAIDKAGGSAASTVMVGDSRTDIDTAKAAGIPVVAVDFGYTDTPVHRLGPDRVISHFDELWRAIAGLLVLDPAATPSLDASRRAS